MLHGGNSFANKTRILKLWPSHEILEGLDARWDKEKNPPSRCSFIRPAFFQLERFTMFQEREEASLQIGEDDSLVILVVPDFSIGERDKGKARAVPNLISFTLQ
jgi:hypothetical protein